jgi:hypothetical protein
MSPVLGTSGSGIMYFPNAEISPMFMRVKMGSKSSNRQGLPNDSRLKIAQFPSTPENIPLEDCGPEMPNCADL